MPLGDLDVVKDCRALALVDVVIVTKPFDGDVVQERLTVPRFDELTVLVLVVNADPVRNGLLPDTVIVFQADELREYVALGDLDVVNDCREEIVDASAAGSITAKINKAAATSVAKMCFDDLSNMAK